MYVGLDRIDIIAIREADAIRKIRSYSTIHKSRKQGLTVGIIDSILKKKPSKKSNIYQRSF